MEHLTVIYHGYYAFLLQFFYIHPVSPLEIPNIADGLEDVQ